MQGTHIAGVPLCCAAAVSHLATTHQKQGTSADGGQLQRQGTAGVWERIQNPALGNQKLLLLLKCQWLGRHFPLELHDALLVLHLCSWIHCNSVPNCNCSHKYSFLARDQVLLKLVSGQDQASSVTILNSGSLLHKPTQILQPRARNSPSFSITSACSIW